MIFYYVSGHVKTDSCSVVIGLGGEIRLEYPSDNAGVYAAAVVFDIQDDALWRSGLC